MAALSTGAPVTLGVIGVGTIARAVHLPLLRRSPYFDLRTVSDLDAGRAAEVAHRYGTGVADVPGLLADPDIEAVLIATPGLHARIARDALQAGKHVLAEKPLALTVADAEQVGDLAQQRGLVLQVGAMKMYDALVPPAREALRQLADVRLVEVSVRHPADGPQTQHLRLDPPSPLPPDAARAGDAANAADVQRVLQAVGDIPPPWQRLYRSVLCGSVLHEMSLLRALGFALPARFDHADIFPWPADGPPSITATATLSERTRLVLSWSWLPGYPEYRESVTVLGAAGAVRLEVAPPYVLDARSELEVVSGPVGDASGQVTRPVIGRDGAFQRQLEAFTASVRHGLPVVSDAAGAAQDVRCLQALLRALAGRHGIELGGEAERAA